MIFNSFEFLIFIPIVIAIYWFLCKKNKTLQNGFIVLASLFFYGWWDWRFLWLLLVTIVSTYFTGILIERYKLQNKKYLGGGILLIAVILNLGILLYYKYANFFIDSFVAICNILGLNQSISTLKIILPIGISFYTFTALGYLFDVNSQKRECTRDFLAYASYVSFFPALFCGPISRSTKQLPQFFEKREFDYDLATSGARMFLWGMFMKLCVADRLGLYVDAVYGNITNHNGTSLLVAAVLYTYQIYADFGGYSYMAIGVGKLFGINLQTNFERPYFARTVTEFWKRWHISLTSWFRDYIYIPLGGNRVPKVRWMLNTMIVFLVSGFWHGAAYNFIVWGGMHGLLLIAEKEIYGNRLKNLKNNISFTNVLRVILTFSLVTIAWIFFRVQNIEIAFEIIEKIFTQHGSLFVDLNVFAYGFAALAILFLKDFMNEFAFDRLYLLENQRFLVRFITCLVLVFIILLTGVLDAGQFIYFQF